MRLLIISTFCIIIFHSTITAQEKGAGKIIIPDNDLGKIVNEFITAINSTDTVKISQFANRYLSENLNSVAGETWTFEKYKSLLQSLKRDGGNFTPVDIRPSGSEDYLAVIFSASKVNKPIGIEFIRNGDNNTLRSMETHVMANPKKPYEWPKETLDEQKIAQVIDNKIEEDFRSGSFSGNILIARGDKIILQKSYGFSNNEKQISNSPETRFHTGSLGKMITATAIAQLVEKGKLNFSDTLGTILKDYPNEVAALNVTIHHLLTHTSGIADPFELGRRKPGNDYSTPGSNLQLFADVPLKFEPGSFHSYSNGNYAVLALIVEKLSGLSFEDYLRENIFIPAEMEIANKESYNKLPVAIRYSYSVENDPFALNSLTPVNDPSNDILFEYSGYCNGYLTASDIYKFLYSLKTGKLVSQEMLQIITAGKVEVEPGAPIKYGYGFYDANLWGVNFRGHSGGGGNSGIGAEAEMLWNNDYYVIALGNCDLEKVRPIVFSITRFLGNQL